jgi:hypothetical protein
MEEQPYGQEHYGRSPLVEAHGEIRQVIDAQRRFAARDHRYEHAARNDAQVFLPILVTTLALLTAGIVYLLVRWY